METNNLIAMNEAYKEITGEEVYLYASKPKGGSVYVFCNAQIPNPYAAERHMRMMLEAAMNGAQHQDIVSLYGKVYAHAMKKAKGKK